MAPAIVTTAQDRMDLIDRPCGPIGGTDRMAPRVGLGAPTIYLDRKSLPR